MPDASKEKEYVDSYLVKKYNVGKRIGKGAYGIVWKVTERGTGKPMALKKCFDAFENSTDAQRTFREIVFLKELNGHANIVRLMSVLSADNPHDIYVLCEAMESDLAKVISAGYLTPIHTEYIMYQLFKALKYIHSAGVLHRDLKPSNMLLNSNGHMRVCDFGLARTSMTPGEATRGSDHTILTDYVATRWYRAPELLLGATYYHEAVDMWSIGCILGEMMSGKPILRGMSTMNQLERILEFAGKPSEEDLLPISSNSPYCKSMMESVSSVRQAASASFVWFVKSPLRARRLIIALLKFNPDKRPTSEMCLEDPFVETFHLQEDEPICDKIIRMPIPDDNRMKAVDYRKHILQDISDRKKQARLDDQAACRNSKAIDLPWARQGGAQAPPTTPELRPRSSSFSPGAPSPLLSSIKEAKVSSRNSSRLSGYTPKTSLN